MTTVPFLDLRSLHAELATDLDACWAELMTTNQFVGGSAVEAFEADWAAYCSRGHAVGVANGTDAIELSLRALDIGPGDEVIVPANTFIATCEAVTAVGATPVFVDIDPETLLMTSETVAPAITATTAAIVVVHLFGHPVDMDDLGTLAADRGLTLIEDAAQAHGATWRGSRIGSFGTTAAFSFYPGKNLGAFGDGGAVVTDDDAIAERIRILGNHGRSLTSHTEHVVDGCNSRLDALQAAILRVKLRSLDSWNARRRQIIEQYRQQLPPRASLLPVAAAAEAVHHLAVVRVPNRDAVRAALTEAGVATGIHYPVPCHRQPPFSRFARGPLPVAEQAAGEILSLPLFPHLTEAQVGAVCQALTKALPAAAPAPV
jgi:dTDP-4-amino-4,6-dideoxygalactose transaminase